MRYLLSIYADERVYAEASEEEYGQLMAAHQAFSREAGDAVLGGEALQPTSAATTVRVRDGEPLLTDGPFAETREQLGGYYVVEAPDLDAAVALAAKIPDAKYGSVEVRPVIDFGEDAAGAGDRDEAAQA